MVIDRHEIENFLYKEARLADEHQYDEWEALWTDDALYWVPSDAYDIDPNKHVSVIYDDREGIARRINRMKSNMAWSQDPKSRLRRVVSNIEIEEAGDGEAKVHSNFDLTEIRRRSQKTWLYIWAGRTDYKLRRENGGWKLVEKKVMLVNNDDALPTLWFLL